jgi:hypothetical protein
MKLFKITYTYDDIDFPITTEMFGKDKESAMNKAYTCIPAERKKHLVHEEAQEIKF